MLINTRLFSGEAPKVSSRLLDPNVGQDAIDCDLVSGELRALRQSRYVTDIAVSNPATLFELDGDFIAFAEYADIAETPVDAADRRLFFTTRGGPRQALVAELKSGVSYAMGVPAPLRKPVAVKVSDSTDTAAENEDTLYVTTFVNRWGEAGPPSPVGDKFTMKRGDKMDVTGGIGDNVDATEFGVERWRLYRLAGTEFRFVAELPISQSVYQDDTAKPTGEILASDTNYPPSIQLTGLHIMSNGIATGFVAGTKTVALSEPYNPNAMPYSFTVSSEIVGLSSYDNVLVVGTKGNPEVATIVDPRSIVPIRLTEREPCLTRKAMVQMDGGVAYPAPSGLFYIGRGGNRMLTQHHRDRFDWQNLQPATMRAAYRDGQYIAFYGAGSDGGGWIYDTREENAMTRRITQGSTALCAGTGTDALYYVDGDKVMEFDAGTKYITYRWRSKEHGEGSPTALTAFRILSDDLYRNPTKALRDAGAAASAADLVARQAAVIRDDLGGEIASGAVAEFTVAGDASGRVSDNAIMNSVIFRLWGDGKLVDEQVVTDQEERRVKYADRKRLWRYELEGNCDVTQVDIAGSVSEMHTGS